VGPRASLDWCGKSRPSGIQFPDRPARKQSLYGLRYPAHTIYTFPLLFVANNSDEFLINSEIQDINIRHSSNLHMPLANLCICQRGDYYLGIKIANNLPFKI